MEPNQIFIIFLFAFCVPLYICWFIIKSQKKPKSSRNPEKEIRRIGKITKSAKLRNEFRKWTNPEIRQAIAGQLSPSAMAELLPLLTDKEKEEILSYKTDLEEMKTIRSYCTGKPKEFAEDRVTSLYFQTISECTDP